MASDSRSRREGHSPSRHPTLFSTLRYERRNILNGFAFISLITSLIAIEGCVGAGKTTIAYGLAGFRKSRVLLEDFSSVPFLEKFYADPVGFALETEFCFLLQHYHQLHVAARDADEVVADFALEKDIIFADLNMADAAERQVFGDLFQLLSSRVPKPHVTVFLSASDELILQRIQARGREFELAAPPDYYRRLNAAYECFFTRHPGPVIRVSADEMDFCSDPELYGWLAGEVEIALRNG